MGREEVERTKFKKEECFEGGRKHSVGGRTKTANRPNKPRTGRGRNVNEQESGLQKRYFSHILFELSSKFFFHKLEVAHMIRLML